METTTLNFKDNSYKITLDSKNGVNILSNTTGISYELLEGRALAGSASSDIVFIMASDDETGYTNLVNFYFGADITEVSLALDYIYDFEHGIRTDLQSSF